MSGISPASGSSSTSSYTANLSSVGRSLVTSGTTPNVVPTAAKSSSTGLSQIQTEFNTLNTQDTQELLYASFLTPAESLANGNAVLEQAAALLGSHGSATSQTTAASTANSTSAASSGTSSTSTASSALSNVPSVASILAASDAEAAQSLQNYANAPAGSSIIDYQA